MRRVTAYFALSRRDRLLLIEALATLLVFRAALHACGIDRLRAWAGHLRSGRGSMDRIVWAVRAVSPRMPGTTCLCSALALQRMLSSRGFRSELHIGVAKHAQRFAAHAWLVREGQVLIGEREVEDYTLLTAWPAGGSSG